MPDRNNSMYNSFEEKLRISMIMMPASRLKTCRINDNIFELSKSNTEQYSFLPVINDTGNFSGILNLSKWFEGKPPNEKVKEYYSLLGVS